MERQSAEEDKDDASSRQLSSGSDASLLAVKPAKLPAKMREGGPYVSEGASSMSMDVAPLPDKDDTDSKASHCSSHASLVAVTQAKLPAKMHAAGLEDDAESKESHCSSHASLLAASSAKLPAKMREGETQAEEGAQDDIESKASHCSSHASLLAVSPAKLPAKMRGVAYGSEEKREVPYGSELPYNSELPSNFGIEAEGSQAPGSALTRLELQDELRVFAAGPMRTELWQSLREAMTELEKTFKREIDNIYGPAELPKGMNGHRPPMDLEGAEEWVAPGAQDHSGILSQFAAGTQSEIFTSESNHPKFTSESDIKRGVKGWSRTQDSRRSSKSSLGTTPKRGRKGGRRSITNSRARASSASSQSSAKSRHSQESLKRRGTNLWRQRKSNMSAENDKEDDSDDGSTKGAPAPPPPQPPVRRRSLGNLFSDAMGSAMGSAVSLGTAVMQSTMPAENAKVAPEPQNRGRRPSLSGIMINSQEGFSDSEAGDGSCRLQDASQSLPDKKSTECPASPRLKVKLQENAVQDDESPSKDVASKQEDSGLLLHEAPPPLVDGADYNGFEPPHRSEASHFDGAGSALLSEAGASCSSEDSFTLGFRHRRGFILSEEFRKQEGLINNEKNGHTDRRSSKGFAVNNSVVPLENRNDTMQKNLSNLSPEDIISYEKKRERCYDKVRRLVDSAEFDYASAVLIITNAILLGTQTDYAARNMNGEEPLVFFIFDRLFCVAFTSELMTRLYVHRLHFVYMVGWRWNVFDIFVVGMQVIEEVTLWVGVAGGVNIGKIGEESGGNFGVLRMIRVLRLVRIIRLARIMHLIGELRTIVVGIFSSMQSLFWTLVLLFLVIYIMAVYITQTVSDHLLEFYLSRENGVALTSHQEQLIKYYGSVPQAILTLYQAISGGMNWGVSSDPLMHSISPGLAILFSVYIGFSIFCLMNITTGVFVESALETAKSDRELFLLHHAHELFRDVDIDGTGTVTWEEFQNHLDKPEMQMYFQAIDLDPDEAEDLFHILDVGGHGYLDVQEFVNGCLRLRGPAKAIDLASFMHEYSRSMKRCQKTVSKVEKQVQFVARNMVRRRQTGRESSTDGELYASRSDFGLGKLSTHILS